MEQQSVEDPQFLAMNEFHSAAEEDRSTTAFWDWSDLLDFASEDQLDIPLDFDQSQLNLVAESEPQQQRQPLVVNSDRVRKRDPRLTCSNFLAGRIPCACPEIDAKVQEEEEAALPGKKRPRTVRAASGQARCQVPGCEVDISELKGYHKRHRVCLRCANASSVLLDGKSKRYCQQCGKFHVLSDFDEGKRSCRRKLERHNNRRRRKSVDPKGAVDNEPPGLLQIDDLTCSGEAGKADSLCLSSQITDQEAPIESEDGHISALHSGPNSQNFQNDSGGSFAVSGETQMDRGKDDSKTSPSPSLCDNKSAYSSLCPTGRISFKLYDWNPAEFPRRLRHQIFEWLANMPVELEGYIRPGCTILTVFVAMPKITWAKLFEDPVTYVHDFVVTPGRMLSGRGPIIVYLNNMILHVKDGTSVMKVNIEVQSPRLHYVHPTCFEAGKPMEFIACGSNLLQPKFRFLISFAGKYLPYDCCVASPPCQREGDRFSVDHQFYKVHVPHTEPDLLGPAFIEVENESGLSNFIPILIGDKDICFEMKLLQHSLETSIFPERSQFLASSSLSDFCKASALRQTALAELVLDIAWLMKLPASGSCQHIMSSSQVQRFSSLFSFLINTESTAILGKMFQNLQILMDSLELNRAVDNDTRLLLKYVERAREILHPKFQKSGGIMLHSGNIVPKSSNSQSCSRINLLVPCQDMEIKADKVRELVASNDESEIVPLMSQEVVMNMSHIKEWPRKSCGHIFSGALLSSRQTITIIAMVAICFGVCVVLVHPGKVGELGVSIRRSLFRHF